eukprot:c7526_g1_i2.p1 GENE.c7526_g1_i2~~c7526_g1_i2.p1  ORF type:complete len:878 (-),score=164.17 c7526_g1_i2:266-2899(-)
MGCSNSKIASIPEQKPQETEKSARKEPEPEPPKEPDQSENIDGLAKATALAKRFMENSQFDLAISSLEEAIDKYGSESLIQTAEALTELGQIYTKYGNHIQALDIQERARKIKVKLVGTSEPSTARSHILLGRCYAALDMYDQATEHGQRAMNLFGTLEGPTHPATLEAMSNLALTYQGTLKYQKAHDVFSEVLKAQQKASLSETDPKFIETLLSLANASRLLKKYDDANRDIERAQTIREKKLGAQHPAVAQCLVALGDVAASAGQTTKAISLFEDAIAMQKATCNKSSDMAEALCKIANMYIARKDSAQAIANLQEALEIQEKIYGLKALPVGKVLFALAQTILLKQPTTDLSKVSSYLERAHKIHQVNLGPTHSETLRVQLAQGNILVSSGDNDAAYEFYRTVAQGHKNSPVESIQQHVNRADALHNIGQILFERGKYHEALDAYAESRPIYESRFGDKSQQIAALDFNVGLACMNLEKDNLARTHFEASYQVRKLTLGDDLLTATSAFYLARVYEDLKSFDEALKTHDEALRIRRKLTGDSAVTGRSIFSIARIHRKKGDSKRAVELLKQAKDVFRALSPPSAEDLESTSVLLGEIYAELDESDAAIAEFKEAIAIREKGAQDGSLGTLYYNLGVLYQKRGDSAEAARCHAQAVKLKGSGSSTSDKSTWKPKFNEAAAHVAGGNLPKGIELFNEVMQTQIPTLGEKHPDTTATMLALASAYSESGDNENAKSIYSRVLKVQEEVIGPDDAATLKTVYYLGILANNTKDKATAAEYLARVYKYYKSNDTKHKYFAQSAYELGYIFLENGDQDAACEYLSVCAKEWEANPDSDKAGLAGVWYSLGEISEGSGDYKAAANWYLKTIHVWEVSSNLI